jgi:hypothetical protein
MLSVKGTFLKGVACPSAAVQGRDGEPVIITFVAEDAPKPPPPADDAAWDSLFRLIEACAVDTGIPDLSHQHDHYIHGKPKRE